MMHEDELTVGLDVASAVIAAQFPHWANESVVRVDGLGTVNAIYRIGSAIAARFPLRFTEPIQSVHRLQHEAAAVSESAQVAPFPSPIPIALGAPGEGYPLPWSIQTWLRGDTATPSALAENHAFTLDLAKLISALRAADTRGRLFRGAGRGGNLFDHDAWIDRCFTESEAFMDVAPFRLQWSSFRDLPRIGVDVMSHGDLIPANLLVADGRLVGVLDTGGFSPADPALDLVAGWHLLGLEQRETLRATLGCNPIEWRRGAAWALLQAIGLVWYYRESNPQISALGRSTLNRLLEDSSL
jgi:aminoglycoside phosphotransferase (APT) family kinase protein